MHAVVFSGDGADNLPEVTYWSLVRFKLRSPKVQVWCQWLPDTASTELPADLPLDLTLRSPIEASMQTCNELAVRWAQARPAGGRVLAYRCISHAVASNRRQCTSIDESSVVELCNELHEHPDDDEARREMQADPAFAMLYAMGRAGNASGRRAGDRGAGAGGPQGDGGPADAAEQQGNHLPLMLYSLYSRCHLQTSERSVCLLQKKKMLSRNVTIIINLPCPSCHCSSGDDEAADGALAACQADLVQLHGGLEAGEAIVDEAAAVARLHAVAQEVAQQRARPARQAAPGGSSSSAGPQAAQAAAAPAAPQLREDARGYVYVEGRPLPLGRLTTWGVQVSARCQVHARCTRPYSFRSMPHSTPPVLHQWLLAGLNCDSAAEHMGLPKPLNKASAAS